MGEPAGRVLFRGHAVSLTHKFLSPLCASLCLYLSCGCPSAGNLHGQYNFQSIAIALVIMRDQYPQTKLENAACLCVVFAGAVFGQLAFGYIGDWVSACLATPPLRFSTGPFVLRYGM